MYLIDKLCKIGSDKYLHCIVSLLITFVAGQLLNVIFHFGLPLSAAIGAAISFDIGLLKEVWDKIHHRSFDEADVLADFIGCMIGLLVTAI